MFRFLRGLLPFQVHPVVKLRRSARVVNRVTNTMGRALSAGIAMGGLVGRSASSVHPAHAHYNSASPDQPELDARCVTLCIALDPHHLWSSAFCIRATVLQHERCWNV
jgi:hypothetical protein